MDSGDLTISIVLALFALAFGAWARRLDRALDMLEGLKKEMNDRAIVIERRLSKLESTAQFCRNVHGVNHPREMLDD